MSKHRKNESLYFAYGANLNLDTMAKRCPTAVPLRTSVIHGYRLVFRGSCDIERHPGSVVYGGIYRVSPFDILALDRFEGVNVGVYRKIVLNDFSDDVFAYVMVDPPPLAYPYPDYLKTVHQGYLDWNLPQDQLFNAIGSLTTKQKTWILP